MRLFIDSAIPDEIRKAYSWGIMNGVTTNPSLMAKSGGNYEDILGEILDIVDEGSTVSAEVLATDFEGMVEQGIELGSMDERIVVKLPCTWNGIRATRALAAEDILVNMTLVFSVAQALLAAKARAFYVSPFVGRLNDREEELGHERIEDIVQMYEIQGLDSQVLYSSVRSVGDVEHAAMAGADIATVKFEILEQLIKHELTDDGLAKFSSDAKEAGLEIP